MDKVEAAVAAFGDEGKIDLDALAAGDQTPGEGANKGGNDDGSLFDDSTVGKEPARDESGRFAKKPDAGDDDEAQRKARGDDLDEEDPEKKLAEAAKSDDDPEKKPAEAAKPDDEDPEKVTKDSKGREVPNFVPRSRMDKEAERRRAAEHLLEQQNRSQQLTSDLVELQTALDKAQNAEIEAMKAGDFDKIPELRRNVDAVRDKIADLKANDIADRRAAAQVEQMRFGDVLSQMKASHPQLDDKHESFDQAMTDEVNDLFDSLKPKYGATVALQKAVEYVVGVEVAGASRSLGEQTPQAKAREERRREGIDKTAKAVSGQPKAINEAPKMPATAAFNQPTTMKDLSKMSEEDLARARGDYLEE